MKKSKTNQTEMWARVFIGGLLMKEYFSAGIFRPARQTD